jgi:hypothetical protein
LHGGLVVSWPTAAPVTATFTVASLTEHMRAVGLPGYAQLDNDRIFQGTHLGTPRGAAGDRTRTAAVPAALEAGAEEAAPGSADLPAA